VAIDPDLAPDLEAAEAEATEAELEVEAEAQAEAQAEAKAAAEAEATRTPARGALSPALSPGLLSPGLLAADCWRFSCSGGGAGDASDENLQHWAANCGTPPSAERGAVVRTPSSRAVGKFERDEWRRRAAARTPKAQPKAAPRPAALSAGLTAGPAGGTQAGKGGAKGVPPPLATRASSVLLRGRAP